ncbi:MAG: hypothetical protein Kow00121_40690 [Elainellaceae cyanobacterium]
MAPILESPKQGRYLFAGKRLIHQQLGISSDMLKDYRQRGLLIENIHWVRLNSRVILYNVVLMTDWVQNRNDLAAHQRAIDLYLSGLACNQRKPRRCK